MESPETETAVSRTETHKFYVCDLCDFSTHYRSSLSRHKRGFHNQGRKFVCPHCDKLFRRGEYLKCHTQAAHGGKASTDPTPVCSPESSEKKEVSVQVGSPKCQEMRELTDSEVSAFFAEVEGLDLQTVEVTTTPVTTLDLLDLLD